MFDLTGKVVLLTGATGGIGKSIAKKMKEKGAKLILSGTRQSIPMEAYTLIVGLYNPAGQSEAWSCDISYTFTRQYTPMEAHRLSYYTTLMDNQWPGHVASAIP